MQIEISRVFDSWGIPGITYDNVVLYNKCEQLWPNINTNHRHLGYPTAVLYTVHICCLAFVIYIANDFDLTLKTQARDTLRSKRYTYGVYHTMGQNAV